MMRDNLSHRGSVLPLSPGRAIGWAKGLGIPRGGRTVLYTGLMYQLMPSMIALEKVLGRFEHSRLNRLAGVGRLMNRVIDGSRFTPILINRADQEMFDRILRDIVMSLRSAGIEFGYLYEEERYGGALAHDEGLCATFQRQALRVRDLFRRHGVKRIITVDPHTTNILRSVYPKALGEAEWEVRSYLEVLAGGRRRTPIPLERSVAVHDSCIYARYEGIVEEPRALLQDIGVETVEPEHSGKMTLCCGGPIESLFPEKARAIAGRRVRELAVASKQVVTMCPICLVNLRAAAVGSGVSVRDISGFLAEALREQATSVGFTAPGTVTV